MNRSRQTIIQICKGHSLYKHFKEATKNLEEFVFRFQQITNKPWRGVFEMRNLAKKEPKSLKKTVRLAPFLPKKGL